MPNGRSTLYGVITIAPALGILPFIDDDNVIMARQWRYVIKQAMWEMPTGAAHVGESLEAAAHRELIEETGYRAGNLRHVMTTDSSKSVVDERCSLYIATDLTLETAQPDPTEFITVATMPFTRVLDMVLSGEITDQMTVVTVLFADRERQMRSR